MAVPAHSLFAPFDLEDYKSLLRLQPGLWTCLGGGTNLSYGRIKYTEEEENAIKATVERMKKSPLLHEIIKFFMDFPIYDAPHLVAVGKQLLQFATVDAEDPDLPRYRRAVKAWEDREFKLTKDFTDDEESSGDDKSLINYNYQPHAPQEPSTEPECPHSQKRKTVVKTEIPDSEDEDADDEADEEEFFYDDNGNVLWGNTIVVDASASD